MGKCESFESSILCIGTTVHHTESVSVNKIDVQGLTACRGVKIHWGFTKGTKTMKT